MALKTDQESSSMKKISVILPVKNEERHILESISSLLMQDYPGEIEIIVADGSSKDKTLAIIKELQKNNRNILLLDNPSGNTAVGRNACIKNSKGDYLINFSGHAVADKNMVSVIARKLDESSDSVGGVGCANYNTGKQNFIGTVAGVVFTSLLGGAKNFDAHSNFPTEREVNSIAFCGYKKEVFEKVGLFDEDFWVGQDGEFNLRLRKAGYKLIFTPETKVYLFKRDSFRAFAAQMFRYGVAARKIGRKHPDRKKILYMIPSLFVIYNIIGLSLLLAANYLGLLYLGSMFAYAVLGWVSALLVTRNPVIVFSSPLFYFTQHLAYGAGYIFGRKYSFK